MNQTPELIDIKELAHRLRVTRQAIDNWRLRGMPYLKAPGRRGTLRFDYAAVMAWLNTRSGDQNNGKA